MTSDQASEPHPDVARLAASLEVTEGIVAGVGPEHANLPTPCPDYRVTQLLDHLVGYATNFADKANGVTPAADPTTTSAGDDPRGAYHDAAVRLINGYRNSVPDDATPMAVVLMETVAHGWDLAAATGQPTPYPNEAVEAAIAAGRAMMAPRFRGEGMPFGQEVEVSPSRPALDQFVAFMGRDPDWSP